MASCQSCGLVRSCDQSQPFTFNGGSRGANGLNGADGVDGTSILANGLSVAGDETAVTALSTYDLDSFDFNTTLFAIGDEIELEAILTTECGGELLFRLNDNGNIVTLGPNFMFTAEMAKVVKMTARLSCINTVGANNVFIDWKVDVISSESQEAIESQGLFIGSQTINLAGTITPGFEIYLNCLETGTIKLHKFTVKHSKKV